MSSLRDISSYFKEHKILELLDHLSEMVLFFKPDDPVDFMASTVLEMKRAMEAGTFVPSLYTEESFRAYFRLLDPAGVGVITWDQLKSAFDLLGLKGVAVPELREMPVFEDAFVDVGMTCVEKRLSLDQKKHSKRN